MLQRCQLVVIVILAGGRYMGASGKIPTSATVAARWHSHVALAGWASRNVQDTHWDELVEMLRAGALLGWRRTCGSAASRLAHPAGVDQWAPPTGVKAQLRVLARPDEPRGSCDDWRLPGAAIAGLPGRKAHSAWGDRPERVVAILPLWPRSLQCRGGFWWINRNQV